jgi:succinate dehydrogenase/fumarate reductase flavoprotein subunit
MANGIDLTQTAVEVGPTAHYHMGGVCVSAKMETRIEGLYAAGEAVGGANGANRLSGNAITEALVFGETAGRNAADHASKVCRRWESLYAQPFVETIQTASSLRNSQGLPPIALQSELQELMWACAGPFRIGDALQKALARIQQMKGELFSLSLSVQQHFNLDLQDWFELKAMLTTAEAVVAAALDRKESRGAHQRLDFPEADPAWWRNQTIEMKNERLLLEWTPVVSYPAKVTQK